MLNRDPSARLGSGPEDHNEIINHPWFDSIDWEALQAQTLEAEYKPSQVKNMDDQPVEPVHETIDGQEKLDAVTEKGTELIK